MKQDFAQAPRRQPRPLQLVAVEMKRRPCTCCPCTNAKTRYAKSIPAAPMDLLRSAGRHQ